MDIKELKKQCNAAYSQQSKLYDLARRLSRKIWAKEWKMIGCRYYKLKECDRWSFLKVIRKDATGMIVQKYTLWDEDAKSFSYDREYILDSCRVWSAIRDKNMVAITGQHYNGGLKKILNRLKVDYETA